MLHQVDRYYFAHIRECTRQMVAKFQEASPEEGWVEEDDISYSSAALVAWIVRSVSTSIGTQVQASASTVLASGGIGGGGGRRDGSKLPGPDRPFRVDPLKPDWSTMEVGGGMSERACTCMCACSPWRPTRPYA